jgi:hypothetical protein
LFIIFDLFHLFFHLCRVETEKVEKKNLKMINEKEQTLSDIVAIRRAQIHEQAKGNSFFSKSHTLTLVYRSPAG